MGQETYEQGEVLNKFYGHDDWVNSLMYYEKKLISVSDDQTIKLWDMRQAVTKFEDNPITIFDHRSKIIAVDILRRHQGKVDE